MYLEIQRKVREKFVAVVHEVFSLQVDPPGIDFPPRPDLGDLSIAACFELAKKLRQPPRKIAEQIAAQLLPLEGVERASIAGAGYVNLHLDRAKLAVALLELRASPKTPQAGSRGKVLIEHTSINPNKAAHIGHLRNAILGDTFVRLRRFRGDPVEVQNYIDNTGVQVADVVVGFVYMEKKSFAEVERLIADPAVRFDYYCWELYARVFQSYEADENSLALRSTALQQIEEGQGEMARIADLVSTAIVRLHLETMLRVNVRYDLLVQESEILRLDFWKSAFALMKERGAIRFEESGKNRGCWVISLGESSSQDGVANTEARDGADPAEPKTEPSAEDVKIIVRSNGTVTYVGKDIAYHLWKFGLLGKDFGYEPFYRYVDSKMVWRTSALPTRAAGERSAPPFGHAAVAYAVIDTRQSYVQNVVVAAFRALGYREQAANLHHFAYEVVGLSPGCAQEMGLELSADDRERSYVEVSGRKGLGIKADDLMDTLVNKALDEVRTRDMAPDTAQQQACARMIAAGALRYFLLKFSRRVIIAFDFKEALAFEGETGPYLQYSVVRARNIFRKLGETEIASQLSASPAKLISETDLKTFFAGEDGVAFWELPVLAAQLEMVADQAIASSEPAALAKYAFRLAQAFNNFYHRFHILNEADRVRQNFLLSLVYLVERTLSLTVDLLGIEIPARM